MPNAKPHAINKIRKCDNSVKTPQNSLTTSADPLCLPCMNITRFSLAAVFASSVLLTGANGQTTATTDPVGFVTVGITAGTGTTKKNTLFSVPLMETEEITGQVAGTITGVSANTISNSNAGWAPGELSQPATPYLIQITSGAAEGRLFLVASSAGTGGAIAGTANTDTTVAVSSLDAAQVNLTTLGIAAGTDTYKIYACDTLSSFFGTPETTGIVGGSGTSSADTVAVVLNGAVQTYWYNTASTPNRWSRVGPGSPNSSNVALVPNYGVQYGRIGNSALSFVVTGQVPTTAREAEIKNSGTTLLSSFWPVESTLSQLGLQALPGWVAGATASVSDTVVLTSGGTASTYWYNGTNWKRVGPGSPISDTTVIGLGTAIQVGKKGTAAGYTALNQEVPYSL